MTYADVVREAAEEIGAVAGGIWPDPTHPRARRAAHLRALADLLAKAEPDYLTAYEQTHLLRLLTNPLSDPS